MTPKSPARGAHPAWEAHPALRAWARLPSADAGAVGAPSVEFMKHVRDGTTFRLRGATADGANVIAIRFNAKRTARERAAYERLLPRLPSLPLLRYYGCVAQEDAGDGGPSHWLFVEDAGGEEYSVRHPRHRELSARWLAAFHTGGARVFRDARDAGLPERDVAWYAGQLRAAAAVLDERRRDRHLARLLPAEGPDALDALASQCAISAAHWDEVEAVCASVPATVVHGDFAARNLRVRAAGDGALELRVFDWEDLAWGTPALDLIRADPEATCDGANPDPVEYVTAARCQWPGLDVETVRRLGEVGRLFWLVLAARLDAEALSAQWVERPIDHLRLYAAELPEVLAALGWGR